MPLCGGFPFPLLDSWFVLWLRFCVHFSWMGSKTLRITRPKIAVTRSRYNSMVAEAIMLMVSTPTTLPESPLSTVVIGL
jgi:hypothetical protein